MWAQHGTVAPYPCHLVQLSSPDLAQPHATVPSGIEVPPANWAEMLKMSGLLFIISYPRWASSLVLWQWQPKDSGHGDPGQDSDRLVLSATCSSCFQRHPGPNSWNSFLACWTFLFIFLPQPSHQYHSCKVVHEKEEKLTALYPA